MKKIFAFLLALLTLLPLNAQDIFSDSVRVSLLTCGQGPDAYERFGHTALRLQDLKRNDIDLVFHYGVFSFHTPHFVWRFVKGETDYQLGAVDTQRFFKEYKQRGLLMYEQVLALDSLQTANLIHHLIVNYQPQNRVYRYNYFFDNCATRPFHLVNRSCNNQIVYDTTWMHPITYRQMVRQKTHAGTWLDFGISLAIGMGADKPIGLNQQVFLPDYLATAYDNASINGHPLIVETDTLMYTRKEVQQVIDAKPNLFDPLPAMTLVLALAVAMLAFRIKQNKPEAKHAKMSVCLSNIFDTLFLLGTGITGCILWFLLLGSEHPTVNENINCVWLWPTNLLFCILIWTKMPQKVHRIYFFINFAALITFYACIGNEIQDTAPAVLVLAAAHLIRDIERAFFATSQEEA